MKTYLCLPSFFWPQFHSGSQFLAPAKNCNFLRFFIFIFFRRVFSEYTEAIATSLILVHIILPEICAFIIGFSCTVWIKLLLWLAH